MDPRQSPPSQHAPQKLGDLLTSPVSTKASLSRMIDCTQCGRHRRASILPGLCAVCFHRIEFERLPEVERQAQIVAVVHERYAHAKIDDLPTEYRTQLLNAPETDSVYIWGPTGTGKTYALAALARHWIETGWRVERTSWERLCLRIRDTFKPQARETEWSIIEPLLAVDKLILEDVGTTVSVGKQETDFSLRVLWLILDSRSEDCLQSCLTGNKPIEELQRSFDARIASRLLQGLIIHKTGIDKRKKERTKEEKEKMGMGMGMGMGSVVDVKER